MAPDVEKHEKNRKLFLKAMYGLLDEEWTKNPNMPNPLEAWACIHDIADRAKLTRPESRLIASELRDEQLIQLQKFLNVGEKGEGYQLTPDGLKAARQYLYDESTLGKRRKIVGAIKEHSASGAASILKEAGKWVGGIVIGAVGANYAPVVTKWVKGLLVPRPI